MPLAQMNPPSGLDEEPLIWNKSSPAGTVQRPSDGRSADGKHNMGQIGRFFASRAHREVAAAPGTPSVY